MAEPIEWKNRVGKSKWQPVLGTGERGWWRYYGWDADRELRWQQSEPSGSNIEPALMSYRRAVRAAVRMEKYLWREVNVKTYTAAEAER